MSAPFAKRLPATVALLESARGKVFPSYAAGVLAGPWSGFAYGGCGAGSRFDLASLTKVICTTTLCLLAEERGHFTIDEPVASFFPAFPDRRVRLSHLLNHSSGLPAWLPLHERFHAGNTDPAAARAAFENAILASWSDKTFDREAVYSDLGFMLLGWVIEKAAGAGLDVLFRDWFAEPAGLLSLGFQPLGNTNARTEVFVPTEDCPWRRRVLVGEVHDDNCHVLGGVAGHAGLFGTAADVLRAGRIWLDAFLGRDSLIPALAARKYWTFTHVAGSTRVLGWDGVSPTGSTTGKYFRPESRGHLGFTGTSLWIDPSRPGHELVVVLLTNRVNPSRDNVAIQEFRPAFHDMLLTELGIAS